MRRMWLAFGLLSMTAAAQQAPPSPDKAAATASNTTSNTEPRTFISAAQIAERIARAGAQAATGGPANGSPLLESGYYRGAMQYLTAPMKIYSQHEDEDELFVVLEGSGTMVLGAKLVNPRRGTGATTLIADSGVGGITHKLVKGDMFILPANSSRSVTQVDGKLVMMSMRLPHEAGPAPR